MLEYKVVNNNTIHRITKDLLGNTQSVSHKRVDGIYLSGLDSKILEVIFLRSLSREVY